MPLAKDQVVVLIAADAEWRAVRSRARYRPCILRGGPFRWFLANVPTANGPVPVRFLNTGCGKVSAAAGTQHVIDVWHPTLVINLGTCGGFANLTEEGEILLVRRTSIYDVHEIKGGRLEQKAQRITHLPLSWVGKPWPTAVRLATIASGDQDLNPDLIPRLRERPFSAIAADWESGAIAYVSKKNRTRCLILRGVSDVVVARPSRARAIHEGTTVVMRRLLAALPCWLERVAGGDEGH